MRNVNNFEQRERCLKHISKIRKLFRHLCNDLQRFVLFEYNAREIYAVIKRKHCDCIIYRFHAYFLR